MPATARTGICFGALLLASCVMPELRGKYPLSKADARQIQHVLVWTIGVPKPVLQIVGDDPIHAHALTGTVNQWGSIVYLIRLERKNGTWTILSKELYQVTRT